MTEINQVYAGSPDQFYADFAQLKKEILKGGNYVTREVKGGVTWRLRHGVCPDSMTQVIDRHNQQRQSKAEGILKDGKKRCVTRVETETTSYVVKEFYSPGPWGSFSSDARGWLYNWLLEFCGLPVPKALAWRHERFGPGHIIFENLPGESGYHVMRECIEDTNRFDFLAQKIMELLIHLYRWRIIHEDFKLSNLLIAGDNLFLVDNDAVIFDTAITETSLERNLRHLTYTGQSPTEARLRNFIQAHISDNVDSI